jgi:hypothetical protein
MPASAKIGTELAGYEDSTPLEALTPGSVTRTLAETFARELAKLYEQLGELYDSAFLDTALTYVKDGAALPHYQA